MAHDVFISYSAKDKAVAESVCDTLEANGVRCWIAPRDIATGNFGAAIIKAINSCQIFLLILSSNSNNSKHVLNEVERAVSKEKIVYPFRIEEVTLSEAMEFFISAAQWLDAFPPPIEPHLKRLTTNVKSTLGLPVDPTPPVVPPREQPDSGKRRLQMIAAGAAAAVLLTSLILFVKWRGGTSDPGANDVNAGANTATKTSSAPTQQAVTTSTTPPSSASPSATTTPDAPARRGPTPILYWVRSLPRVPGDAEDLLSNALGSWQTVVATPLRRADSEADANVIIYTAPDALADTSRVGPPQPGRPPIEIRFGSTTPWTRRTFQAAACRMFGHVLGLPETRTPGQVMTTGIGLEELPLKPQTEDVQKVRKIWDK